MGVDLANSHGQNQHLNWPGWTYIMTLALAHGWKPLGTRLSDDYGIDPDWDGGYGSNDGQVVTAEDADALATALERALACHPCDDVCVHGEPRDEVICFREGRAWLRQMIAFFRQGGFAIY
jgi:hypothetical protein